ncbi:MAG: ImmA/IrrE family metallo-endopeptidase [Synechococcus sp. SB0668_bin_15]|nr:ImmA/IrrE family metallo-endopeptidase [Synechococcus sp. SB0668_bin_15]MXZ83761.1 ImmA/IrrE family metallo-endopeptidase [Synechococcus sp. SB0666_bin_14]MYC50100.1 ImmA/IrrE family metallo-endopeptidase [Synechococcus sp. SB0662_bin_14]MYG47682.1 ImmA/IrrE family metallo-endopeptidase [Synechococcus sp. SB0675_bin_6]MYJ59810.1 ImmA/IrrE family metallo-endopeptidase [Synechococcus sp. SB0672_bin_6]MYK91428.1 ImmA/IrrE family metallo-endopeptidase [Synechococcus sp. SB0669_bin_8]
MFSERLKLARKRHGLSLRNLSSRLTGLVSAQAIGKYERGEMMPSSPVAIALAKALDVSVSYLLSPSVLSLQAVEFRKKAATKAREQAMVKAAVLDHVDRYLQVEQLLALDDGDWDIPANAPYKVKSLGEAESAAEALRCAWDLGGGPISNLTELLEERRIKVLKLDLPNSVDGLTCFVRTSGGGNIPVVVCSTAKSVERQRFTLAHELGHMVMEVSGGVDEEKACHRFAGALLAPRQELVRDVGLCRRHFGFSELVAVKNLFGISAAALVIRMRDLGIVGETAVQNIFRGVGRTWRTKEPCPLDWAEEPRRFHRLCFRALAEDVVSESKAAELLNIPVSEVERAMVGSAS